ncbi:TPA: hypothetical protein PXM11_003786 [Yersinia enterocolitica]|uniref:hypothetical protein n=1 Tax=Yersinia enterocolitica TaxID=630 RepID=UPI0005DBA836|nr:hypothetical protein [Yersinia enterocolitica]CNG40268.1 Uncharacterised protein [Yersinia enterocolitica]HDL6968315.1 hypothetical protein [Yersinia enterocolitica]HDL6972524.1 hypothetical protein [Yersinia enterocolitica]HDL6976678.1 hypothetical protein [Yersinia enterocolitica]HDL6989033.1 hypothetical protein [Yersinia enterocolitica]
MRWILLSGVDGDFMNAPLWAKRLVIIDGKKVFWDGMRKFQDEGGNEFVLSDRFEGDYRLLAERRLVPITPRVKVVI